MAKLLSFARRPTEPHLDVCLVNGGQRLRYVVVAVTESTWESGVEGPVTIQRRLVSRDEAVVDKAQFELEIATRLGAGWVVESRN